MAKPIKTLHLCKLYLEKKGIFVYNNAIGRGAAAAASAEMNLEDLLWHQKLI